MYKTEFCQCLYNLEGLDIPFIGSHFTWSSRREDNDFVVKAGQGDREYQVFVPTSLGISSDGNSKVKALQENKSLKNAGKEFNREVLGNLSQRVVEARLELEVAQKEALVHPGIKDFLAKRRKSYMPIWL